MIEVKHLTKRFGHNTAVDNISFTVKKGEVLGFVVGDADPPAVDVAYHCALDLLVRGRAVEPSLAAPQEEPTAPAPKHLEPTRAPAAALGDATNVVH